ncbi:MAG: 4'-phosphopantetheinyl transferase family protein [Eubacteriaceae bacterium]|jgi:phosphopantetheinyl transferase
MFRIYKYTTSQDGQLSDSMRERALQILPEGRKNHIADFKSSSDRDNALIAYLLLAYGLSSDFGIDELPDFEYLDSGKPFLPENFRHHGRQLYCSLSHTDGACAAVLADFPIGVDVQSVERNHHKRVLHQKIAGRLFSRPQQDQMTESGDPDRTFTRFFAVKEAVAKMKNLSVFN